LAAAFQLLQVAAEEISDFTSALIKWKILANTRPFRRPQLPFSVLGFTESSSTEVDPAHNSSKQISSFRLARMSSDK